MRLFFFLSFFLSLASWAQVGDRFAIKELHPQKGLRVDPLALKRMKIVVASLQAPYVLKEEAIIFFKDKAFVYVQEGSFFRLIEIKAKKQSELEWLVESPDLGPTIELVTRGAELLHLGQIMNQTE